MTKSYELNSMISYPLSVVNVLVSAGLMHIYLRPSKYPGWAPGIRATLPVTIFFLVSNIYLTVAPFLPPPNPKDNVYVYLPYYSHCVAGLSVFVIGAIYWVVWAKFLPWLKAYNIAEHPLEENNGAVRTVAVRVPSVNISRRQEKRRENLLGWMNPFSHVG